MTLTLNSTSSGTGRNIEGNGSSVASYNFTILYCGTITGTLATANTFGSGSLYIPNYTSTIAKSVSIDNVYENNATGAGQNLYALSAPVTTGITSITLGEGSSGLGYAQYSTASLYGITKGSGGATVS
jgi:hypothetical protein